MVLKLSSIERKLDLLLADIEKIQDDSIKAEMSKYFCICISGYLENVIKILISEYATNSSQKPLVNYLLQDLKNITNLSDEKMQRLLNKFSSEWNDLYCNEITDQQRQSLNSIISNRNNIAHGQPCNISCSIIKQYYQDLKAVIIILKKIVKK